MHQREEARRELDPYLYFMPQTMHVLGAKELIRNLWKQIKQKFPKKRWKEMKKAVSDKTEISLMTFDAYLKGRREPTLRFLTEISHAAREHEIEVPSEKEILRNRRFRFGVGMAGSCNLPYQLTPDLAYLLGALRDGTITDKKKYEISFYQKDTRWFSVLTRCLQEVFNPSSKIFVFTERRNSSPKLTVSCRPIVEFLKLVCGVPAGDKLSWQTPRIIKNADWEIQRHYIRGFFDADGRTSIRFQKVGFCQASESPLSDIKEMLEKHGIKCRKVEAYKPKNKGFMFSLYITTGDILDFIREIGSSNPQKYERLLPERT